MKGAIAKCSQGFWGLITSGGPEPVTYSDGTPGVTWVGIHLGTEDDLGEVIAAIGDPWSSRNPIIMYDSFADLLACVEY